MTNQRNVWLGDKTTRSENTQSDANRIELFAGNVITYPSENSSSCVKKNTVFNKAVSIH